MSVGEVIATSHQTAEVKKLGLKVLEAWSDKDTCETVLHRAAANPTCHILKYLLSVTHIRAMLNDITVEERSALHIAANCGLQKNVKLLLNCQNILVNPRDNSGDTPLHIAVYEENLAIIESLLICGADFSVRNFHNETPVEIAVKQCIQAVPLFLHNGTSLHELLLATAAFGSKPLFHRLLNEWPDCDMNNDEILFMCLFRALANEHQLIVKLLLPKLGDMNRVVDGKVPLVQATMFGMKNVVKKMVKKFGASDICDDEGLNAVVCACINNDAQLLSFLFERGFSVVSKAGVSALQHSIERGHVVCTKMCLESGVAVHNVSIPRHVSSEEFSLLSAAGFLLSREGTEITNGSPGSLLDFCRIVVKRHLPLQISNALSLVQGLSSSSRVQHTILFGKHFMESS